MDDEQTLMKLARCKELMNLRNTQLLKGQDQVFGLSESHKYLYNLFFDHRLKAEIALPKYPDKADVLTTFNEF